MHQPRSTMNTALWTVQVLWGVFFSVTGFGKILVFKAANAGKQAVAVPPAYTSQRCSGCGAGVAKGLSVRWHAYPDCGASLHRDHNAALNILRAGQARQGVGALAPAMN
jgi:transposase